MTENQKNLYKLIFKIALEYRLSLENVCILLGEKPTEENKREVYNNFELLFGSDSNKRLCYIILFDYETPKDSEKQSNASLALATLFFNKYKLACKDKDMQRIKELTNELNSLDLKIKRLKFRDKDVKLTKEEYLDVIKYRVKYSISRANVSEMLKIKRDTLKAHEERLQASPLKQKVDILSDYYLDVKNRAAVRYK